jgi:hypothetical protein
MRSFQVASKSIVRRTMIVADIVLNLDASGSICPMNVFADQGKPSSIRASGAAMFSDDA